MKKFISQKGATLLVALATIILAGVAIFTALRLYRLRQESVSPAAPESVPLATERENEFEIPKSCKQLSFTIASSTPTPTDTPEPTATGTLTPPEPTNTPVPTNTPTNTPVPTNPPVGGGPSPTPQPTSTSTPTPPSSTATAAPTSVPIVSQDPELPPAGVGLPTIIATTIGFLLMALGIAFAL